MSGVYVHIPFCKSRCRYCDFFSTTLLERRKEYVDAVIEEWNQRSATYVPPTCIGSSSEAHRKLIGSSSNHQAIIETLYLGGGTPTMLEVADIKRLVDAIATEDTIEITLEANPSDLDRNKLLALRQAGINRLSIGIQAFDDALLQLIGRRHNAAQAVQAVKDAQDAGFDNISIDLIYGLPTQTMDVWKQTISRALALNVQHISCYCLSYEEGTPLTKMLEKGEIQEIDEVVENKMFDYLCEQLKKAGYVHYEVSNSALVNYHSHHNSSYWNDTPYVGLGAGAHGYDGNTRYQNISDIERYIKGIQAKQPEREEEQLSEEQKHIERIMLSLRTDKGIDEQWVLDKKAAVNQYLRQGLLRREGTRLIATQQGLHILNRIIEDLI
ncbi:MAG: radical SAM family heme chaperone HemW [Paludibacteraceae bacterium]|nr:radical SAM family heme chaperone HemW [Paludibacteraceae bacterium]